ncbi:uncharacterized protein LOC126316668 isoform X1 [Schistocerca gregaria]|uniref:uncharacterized protein LOC126316668 isoform X1 n=1 Tax=Schistocerca gregaria TaxID=7010 RepID=UPI00211E35AC|nr:uncharacterized protein LOC126316668 isoform X1 [Schistocerca gregaria]
MLSRSRLGGGLSIKLSSSPEEPLLSETVSKVSTLPPEQALLAVLSDETVDLNTLNQADKVQLTKNDNFLFALKSLRNCIIDRPAESSIFVSKIVDQAARVKNEKVKLKLFYAVDFLLQKNCEEVTTLICESLQRSEKHAQLGICRMLVYLLDTAHLQVEMAPKKKKLIEVLDEPNSSFSSEYLSRIFCLSKKLLPVLLRLVQNLNSEGTVRRPSGPTLLGVTAADCFLLLYSRLLECIPDSEASDMQQELEGLLELMHGWFVGPRPMYGMLIDKLRQILNRNLLCVQNELGEKPDREALKILARLSVSMIQTLSEKEDIEERVQQHVKFLHDRLLRNQRNATRMELLETFVQLFQLCALVGKLAPNLSSKLITAYVIELHKIASASLFTKEKLIFEIGNVLWKNIKAIASDKLLDFTKESWMTFLENNAPISKETISTVIDIYANEETSLLEKLRSMLLSEQKINSLAIFQYILNDNVNASLKTSCVQMVMSIVANSGLNEETCELLNWIEDRELKDILSLKLDRLLDKEGDAIATFFPVFSHSKKGPSMILYFLDLVLEQTATDLISVKENKVDHFFELLSTWSQQHSFCDSTATDQWEKLIFEMSSRYFQHADDVLYVRFFSALSCIFSRFLSTCFEIVLQKIESQKLTIQDFKELDESSPERVQKSLIDRLAPYLMFKTLDCQFVQLQESHSSVLESDLGKNLARVLAESIHGPLEYNQIRQVSCELLTRFSPSDTIPLVLNPLKEMLQYTGRSSESDSLTWTRASASIYYFCALIHCKCDIDQNWLQEIAQIVFSIFLIPETKQTDQKLQTLKQGCSELMAQMMATTPQPPNSSQDNLLQNCLDKIFLAKEPSHLSWLAQTIKRCAVLSKGKKNHLSLANTIFSAFVHEASQIQENTYKIAIIANIAAFANMTLGESQELMSNWAIPLFDHSCSLIDLDNPALIMSGLQLLGSLMTNAIDQLFTDIKRVVRTQHLLSKITLNSNLGSCQSLASELLKNFVARP